MSLAWLSRGAVRRLIEPNDRVTDTRQREMARVVASLAMALLVLNTAAGALYFAFTRSAAKATLLSEALFLVVYLLSRTARPHWGGAILTLGVSMIIYAQLPGASDPAHGLVWIVFPVLLSTVLLPLSAAVAAATLNLASMAICVALLPRIQFLDALTPILVVAFVGLIGLVSRYVHDRDLAMLEERTRALDKSQKRYRGLFEDIPIGLYEVALSGELLDVNRACAELLGFSSHADLLTRNVYDLCIDVEQRRRRCAVLKEEKIVHRFESRFRRADGQVVWVRESMRGVYDSTGHAIAYTGSMEDVTGAKLAEQELMTLASVVEQSADTIVLTDLDGKIVYANPSFERTSGYPVPEVIGKNPRLLKSGHQDDAFYRHLWETITSGSEWSGVLANRRKDGSIYREEATIFPIKGLMGELHGYAAIKRDITERLQTLEWLEQRNLELAALNSLAQVLATSLELDDLLDEALSRVSLTLGFSGGVVSLLDERAAGLVLASFTGLQPTVVAEIERRGLGGSPCETVYARNAPIVIADVRLECVDDVDRLVGMGFRAYAGVPIAYQGKVLGVLSLYDKEPHPLSESEEMLMVAIGQQIGVATVNARLFQETQQRVRELEMLYNVGLAAALGLEVEEVLRGATEALVRQFPDSRLALLLVDRESNVLRVRAGAGYDQDSLQNLVIAMGKGITGWVAEHGQPLLVSDVHEDPRYIEVVAEVRSELCVPLTVGSQVIGVLDVASPLAYPLTGNDQRLLSVLANTLAMMIERARLFEEVGAARVEAQQRAQEIESANKRLQELDRLKSEFLANMSHELRTPLNAILGFAQLALRSSTLPAEHRESLEIIHGSGEHLLDLINDVLDMSRIESGRMTFDPVRFDLHSLLDSLRAMVAIQAERKGLWLRFDCEPALPRVVQTDERKLRQVLTNLLNNAVKFTKQGGVTVRVGCSGCGETATDHLLHFEVEDTGVGIDPDEMGMLFQAFSQTASGRASQEGTGLGLPISRKFIEMMGGELTVRSQVGVGSVFAFNVRAERAEGLVDAPVASGDRAARLREGQPECRVLIADDRVENRLWVSQLLTRTGFVVREASDGQEAVACCREWRPHAVLMDMRMPVMDGYEAARRIKSCAQCQGTVVIALTASALKEDRQEILAAGCDDYVPKPFCDADIFGKLAMHLGVEYVYEGDSSRLQEVEQADGEGDTVSMSRALATLPPEWLSGLRDAATRARTDIILELLAQLDQDHDLLAREVARLADEFRYDSILALLDG